ANRAARAGEVLDHHVLPQDLRQSRRQDPRGAVGRAAGGEGNDDGDRPGRPILRRGAQRGEGAKHDADRDRFAQQGSPAHVSAPCLDRTYGHGRRRKTADVGTNRRIIIPQELWVSPETATSRIAPNAKPTTPSRENRKTCHPFSRIRSGSLKKSVSSLLIGMTGNSCAKPAHKHQIGPRFFAAGTVHQRSNAPASQKASTQGTTLKV